MNKILTPSTAWFTLTRACNNRCQWCYAQGTNFNRDEMNLSLLKKLVSFSKKINIKDAILIGGEPTVFKKLPEVISIIKKSGINVGMPTNGRLLSDFSFAKDLVDCGLSKISISIKGATPEQYFQLAGVNGYEEALSGYDNIRRLGLDIGVTITVTRSIYEKVDLLIKDLSRRGVDHITVDFCRPIILNDGAEAKETLDPREIADACSHILEITEDEDLDCFFIPNIPFCLLSDLFKEKTIKNKKMGSRCPAQIGTSIIFDFEGNVLPCNSFVGYPLGKYGKEFSSKDDFEIFWGGKAVKNFRNLSLRYPNEKCFKCKDWIKCGGGCCIRWMYYDPAEFIV